MIHEIFKYLIVLLSFLGMEGVAWFTHKYIMHGVLWSLHSDHHKKEQPGYLEKNDWFFLIFAIPGISFLAIGTYGGITPFAWIGTGITLYGACYFFVHDIFIHQRLKFLRNSENRYLKAIRRAHKMHHKHTGKEFGECFGMLWVPFKYFRENNKSKSA
ncbi:sterol desaturase family protein [Mucilaginibacter flavus]|uniref:sterol desaturase family protein n=1 Tax=Mucilaginibacter flavus TaxID=931504 RepID=UPI0025B2A31A|nr:sterol desaturase family protein [Mucilaginibacter flavus]MDN3584577.1 sterol desaturase family protein [Mucilaginibacter flavus]